MSARADAAKAKTEPARKAAGAVSSRKASSPAPRRPEPAARPGPAGFAGHLALFALLRAGHLRLHDRLERRFADGDLTVAQFELMALVRQNPEASQGDLAEALSVNRATVVRWVEGLVEGGLLTRSARPPDRRIKRLQLTAKGRRRMTSFERRFEEVMAPLREGVGSANYLRLVKLLGQLELAGRETIRHSAREDAPEGARFKADPRA